ncbi:MAG: pentapeptide repeat-containing protein [Pseudanabaena sp. CAN_BIN31]|nr:pentapeptide repeat-containing protein [Pseudanabaena sp. CAN_BIN31]
MGGHSYYRKDLTNTTFDGADLRNTDLRETILTNASFVGVKNLELARVKGTILEDKRVRALLIDPQSGQRKNFCGANFSGANLENAQLEKADMTGANLQGVNLRNAKLAAANLTGVNAIDADFEGAILHDICIQDWNVSKKTNFKNVQCRRIYLKQNQEEPKPDSGVFGDGEFEKWIVDVHDTIDLIFQNGLNLRSLAFAITQVNIDQEDTQIKVESFAHKGDGVVVVKVGIQNASYSEASGATKENIHAAITLEYTQAQEAIAAGYELLLRAKDDQLEKALLHSDRLHSYVQGLIGCMNQPSLSIVNNNSTQQGNIMAAPQKQVGGNNEEGNRINVSGNFTNTGSTVNLGELSGQVTNSIQQLKDVQTGQAQDLAKMLASLQSAIQEDQNLKDATKVRSLEEVKVLSEEAKKEPDKRNSSLLSKAIASIATMGEMLSDSSKLAKVCQTYLPTIAKFFGI